MAEWVYQISGSDHEEITEAAREALICASNGNATLAVDSIQQVLFLLGEG